MATVTLQLPDEIEKRLETLAAGQRRDVPDLCLEILEKWMDAAAPPEKLGDRPYAEWRHQFLEWANSRPRIDVVLDDSRETIYEGR